jgi:hypothetical protein
MEPFRPCAASSARAVCNEPGFQPALPKWCTPSTTSTSSTGTAPPLHGKIGSAVSVGCSQCSYVQGRAGGRACCYQWQFSIMIGRPVLFSSSAHHVRLRNCPQPCCNSSNLATQHNISAHDMRAGATSPQPYPHGSLRPFTLASAPKHTAALPRFCLHGCVRACERAIGAAHLA